jgi:predicted KAP-like P-loop ATPase
VRATVSDCAPVVALTGTYGDGKSSVLNLVANEIDARQDSVCVRFSPWLPGNEDSLVSSLFGTILKRLEKSLVVPSIKRDFLHFTRILFAAVPRVGSSLSEMVEKPSQEQRTADLRESLSRLPFRVLVLLDDMDRMPKNELNVLFKVLRGVPEFPHLSYVCAFDRSSLVRILAVALRKIACRRQRTFIEKFFPEEIQLPKIEPSRLAVEFERRLSGICDRNNLLDEPAERKTFQDEWRPVWEQLLKGFC